MWVHREAPSGEGDISLWSIATLGGEPRLLLEGAAEIDWSADGTRTVYHTPAPGDPMFVSDANGGQHKIFAPGPGVHNHYEVWSPDDRFIYFVSGGAPYGNDVWRISPSGGAPERMTSLNARVTHLTFVDDRTLLYLSDDAHGAGPSLYALDAVRRTSRRISLGLERFTSVASSQDGRRLVVTVANPRRTFWRVPIGDRVAEAKDATRVSVPMVGGRAPRAGPGYLLYVSSGADSDTIWKLAGEHAAELWSAAGARVIGRPAIAPGGDRTAFTAEEHGRTRLLLMGADGSSIRSVAEPLQPRGTPAWSPDGTSIAVAAMVDNAPRLVIVSVADGKVTPIGADFATDPAWSSDGKTIVYSGREVGTTFPIRAVRADGSMGAQPKIVLSRGLRQIVFLPGRNSLVVLRGDLANKDVWAIDLDTGRERRLTNFGRDVVIGDFDVTPDGRELVFDRERDDSDIAMIER